MFWHGYTDAEADSMNALLDEWNSANPDIQVEPLFVNNDKALQKLTVALQGGEPPDITQREIRRDPCTPASRSNLRRQRSIRHFGA